ncbi:uncharacterized protein LOC142231878 [Haematobia irritans]|uniref:uncharacterized protein LOC142231878 n=1 Tax=Haematobia irritans TaxID=7368 RepID=UPI003F50489A
MKFKISLVLLTFLLGISLTHGYASNEDEMTDNGDSNAGDSKEYSQEAASDNDEIYDPALLQQQVEADERRYMKEAEMEREAEMETEATLKTVRNISHNQLTQTNSSQEGEMLNHSTEDYLNDSKMEEEETEASTEGDLSKTARMGRLLPSSTTTSRTPTHIPDYIRQSQTSDDLNQSQEHANMSEYIDDENDPNSELLTQIKHPSTDKSSTSMESSTQLSYSKENEDIVPMAMRFYNDGDLGEDEMAVMGAVMSPHVNTENGYSEKLGDLNKFNNEPVPMPQQQWLPMDQRQGSSTYEPQQQQQQNSSEEYYDEDDLASRENDSSTATVAMGAAMAAAVASTTQSPSVIRTTTTGDHNIVVFAGIPLSSYQTTTIAPTYSVMHANSPPTIGMPPLVTPMSNNGPFEGTMVATPTPPPPPYPVVAAAAAAAAAAPASGDKKGKQIPIVATTISATTATSTGPSMNGAAFGGGSTPKSISSSMPTNMDNSGNSIATTSNALNNNGIGIGGAGGITSRRHLLPHEQLRNYIEDAYIRMPLAVIVDPSSESLEKTKALWNEALRENLNIKIILVTLNESDIPAAFNFNNTRQFLIGLNSIKEHEGGDAFRGISHAAELVPYDSAVFISTATLANHTDQVHDAAITLLKKRIRLYLIWFGERALSENETQETVGGILGEVAIRSGGEVLHIVGNENSLELEGSTLTIVADALRGSQELDVPVDTTLSSLHVKIDKLMRRAVLETPNGEINLKKLVKFKTRLMITKDDDKRLDAYVPLTKLRKATVYKLKIIPEDLNSEYTVFIRGERKADTFLDDMIKHFETYFYEGHTLYPARLRNGKLQSITSALALANVPTHSNIRFPDDKIDSKEPKDEVETFSSEEIHRNMEDALPSNATALAEQNDLLNQRGTNALQRKNTKIELGIHSQVLIVPGMMGQLYFEVTNTGCDSIFYNIQVIDEKRYLMRLAPQSIFLRAGQMATVTVTVLVPQATEAGTIDHITFSATGASSTTSLSVNLKVITAIDIQDNVAPTLDWNFGSRCESIVSTDSTTCADRFWTLYITAQDTQTGIMRLQSTPTAGLVYTGSYTIGSAEPLKATYIATCCEPKVNLVVYDVVGNQRSYSIDVRDLVLTEASIAAISLGVILLIIILILLIWAIVWCCRRRKIVLDMPTYRSHSTRSME